MTWALFVYIQLSVVVSHSSVKNNIQCTCAVLKVAGKGGEGFRVTNITKHYPSISQKWADPRGPCTCVKEWTQFYAKYHNFCELRLLKSQIRRSRKSRRKTTYLFKKTLSKGKQRGKKCWKSIWKTKIKWTSYIEKLITNRGREILWQMVSCVFLA